MLSERVHATPTGDDERVEEFLRSSRPTEPELTYEEKDCKDDAVADECRAHDKVGGALAEVIALAEAQRCDAAEEHLHP